MMRQELAEKAAKAEHGRALQAVQGRYQELTGSHIAHGERLDEVKRLPAEEKLRLAALLADADSKAARLDNRIASGIVVGVLCDYRKACREQEDARYQGKPASVELG